jgi:glycosyltransferase involved in cell wall biosynthesis
MRVMMVTKFLPVPANTGGKRRSLAILERYLARGDDVVLVAHDDGTADMSALASLGIRVVTVRWSGGLRRLLRGIARGGSAILGRFYTPELHARARAIARDRPFDVLQIEYLHNCVYGDCEAAIRVLDLHDVASEQARRIAEITSFPLKLAYRAESVALARRERTCLREYEVVACVSEHDADLLGAARVHVSPNGWEATGALPQASSKTVLFVANFAFASNVDAAAWFTGTVWPKVRAAVPDADLLLVGKDPAPQVRALDGKDGVTVTGTVKDVMPYLERARVAIAPLRAGSGSRLKILEALEAGRPVVSTTVGLEGLEALRHSGVLLADEPGAFASAVVGLLGDPARAQALGALGRRAVHETLLWDRTLAPMFDAIDRAVAVRATEAHRGKYVPS